MKLLKLFTFGLVAVLALAAAPVQAGESTEGAEQQPAFTDVQLCEAAGWVLAARSQFQSMDLSGEEKNALIAGFTRSLNGEPSALPLAKAGPLIDQLFTHRQIVRRASDLIKGQAEEATLFESLKANPLVLETPSGLRYEIIEPGTGGHPGPADTVTVHYEGTLVNGTVFDSSRQRGSPATFALTQVIPGWTEGVQLMQVGGRAKFYIPASLAYGDTSPGGIPAGAALTFDVELLSFEPAVQGREAIDVAHPQPAPQ